MRILVLTASKFMDNGKMYVLAYLLDGINGSITVDSQGSALLLYPSGGSLDEVHIRELNLDPFTHQRGI